MAYDKALIAGKLRRWEKYLDEYRLPQWQEIPDFGLYMDQLTTLLQQYLDYLPEELKEEQFITAATINNYVRTRVMPKPRSRKYYRVHIAYLIIILSLKQSLSIALIQKVIPMGLEDEQVEQAYSAYAQRHRRACIYFMDQIRSAAGPILDHTERGDFEAKSTEELISMLVVMSGLGRLLTEKLLLLEGKDLTNGGSIALAGVRRKTDSEEK